MHTSTAGVFVVIVDVFAFDVEVELTPAEACLQPRHERMY